MTPKRFLLKTEGWTLVALAAVLVAGRAWAGLAIPAWTIWFLGTMVVADVLNVAYWANRTFARIHADWGAAPTADDVAVAIIDQIHGGDEEE